MAKSDRSAKAGGAEKSGSAKKSGSAEKSGEDNKPGKGNKPGKSESLDPHPSPLDALAKQYGIALTRPEPNGQEVPISQETKRKILAALNVTVDGEDVPRPPVCFLPQLLARERVWGLSLQLYELRSARNWGIGDFADLQTISGIVGPLGADFIGLNPLHAPFLADPDRCSPYEPSNRGRLNPLYIAVDKVAGFAPRPELDAELAALRGSELVDYAGVAAVKLRELRNLWSAWRDGGGAAAPYDLEEFNAFRMQGGELLRLHALFETISQDMVERGRSAGWRDWPEEMQAPDNPAVQSFAQSRTDQIEFQIWLQWLAHVQLSEAADAARAAGLRLGLYLDLAVGEALDGSATWSEPDIYVSTASIGGPPDPWAVDGQDWRLAAFLPSRIARGEASPYRRMLDASMRYAGAIRIDHAAALQRLFLVPFDSPPSEGAYVDYPKDELLQVLSDASHDHHCLVIGEDLGNLPKGLREDLSRSRLLSYRIFSYERDDEGFIPAEDYPAVALACVSTHDHQTLGGWWRGDDIHMRVEHGLVPAEMADDDLDARAVELVDLVRLLEAEDLPVPEGESDDDELASEDLDRLIVSLHRFLARTPSLLLAVRLADLTREDQPTNVPGTHQSYPNWRPKLSVAVEELGDLELMQEVCAALREERPRGAP
ncbi:4-alpha-glucanotransferase [Rhizobium sp. SSA_523]|uniref:4-alpha-glucanotransferase n=1 Tax=Rhizobium sp. SSA_523 TaxID=2952477 RepID=UPI0020909429|nr:4-alpha-glucanotransferase [Rhizobium sp. SSA_523]MCO5731671.1 4-alpha-glucanotransferase [Rhizobium sp. SSA_523]WKC22952.1 4-alpha-glucanotransferase [Rhizobium sp. SSA_523]